MIIAVFRDLGNVPVSSDEFMILNKSGAMKRRTDFRKVVGKMSNVQVDELRLYKFLKNISVNHVEIGH